MNIRKMPALFEMGSSLISVTWVRDIITSTTIIILIASSDIVYVCYTLAEQFTFRHEIIILSD